MLVSFTFENWRSFRDASILNLVASSEKQHGNRVSKINKYGFRLLPTAAIYGGNASGKSNLIKALQFAGWMITQGPAVKEGIPLDTYRLDDTRHKPSRFAFVILVKDKENDQEQIYEYGFTLNKTKVLDEKLVCVHKSSEIVLFERQDGVTSIFHKSIKDDPTLHAVLNSTRDNQLFLTNAAGQNTSLYKTKQIIQVFDWFARLTLISPDDVVLNMKLEPFIEQIGDILALMGVGIEKLKFVEMDFASSNIPPRVMDDVKKSLLGDSGKVETHSPSGDRYIISGEDGKLTVRKLVSVHQGDIDFDLKDDSDGTVRVVDLLPAFLGAARQGSERVYVIDELDRSLHTLLTRQLLKSYFMSCFPESRSQIIFTTHDALQMDQNLLRRDEMWITDRKNDGSTELVPLSSFKEIRKDKSIRTSYLRGQLGGIPKLLLHGAFPQEVIEEDE